MRGAEERLRAELCEELGQSLYSINSSSCSRTQCRSTILTSAACWQRSKSLCSPKQQPRLLRQEDHNRVRICLQYVSLLVDHFPPILTAQLCPHPVHIILFSLLYNTPRHCLSFLSHIDVPLWDSSAYHLHYPAGTLRHTLKEKLIRKRIPIHARTSVCIAHARNNWYHGTRCRLSPRPRRTKLALRCHAVFVCCDGTDDRTHDIPALGQTRARQ